MILFVLSFFSLFIYIYLYIFYFIKYIIILKKKILLTLYDNINHIIIMNNQPIIISKAPGKILLAGGYGVL